MEFRAVSPDGQVTRWFSQTTVPMRDDVGAVSGIQCIAHDITERREMQEQIASAERLADLGRMAASLAHEIRNPLGAIVNSINALKQPRAIGDHRLHDIINEEARRLDGIISEFLMFARPPAAVPVVCNVAELIETAVILFEQSGRLQRAVDLRWSCPANTPDVMADPNQMRQVLWNLIANAVDATGAGGHVDVVAASTADGQGVTISVVDDGPGRAGRRGPLPSILHDEGPRHRSRPGGRQTNRARPRRHDSRRQAASRRRLLHLHDPRGPAVPPNNRRDGMTRVLLVDDQANLRRSTGILLEQDGCQVYHAAGVAEALSTLAATGIDVVLTDVRMNSADDGRALLATIKGRWPDIEVVLITAFATIDDAVEAIKAGAYDYLTKPLDPARLLITVRRAAERASLAGEVRRLRTQVDGESKIIAASQQMQQVLRRVAQLATTDSTVLITGESGTGKELVARALHAQSRRRNNKFVPINCGAMPESIMESELFGHRKGSFTGAISDKKGLLEEAHHGVLFLDEIGEMAVPMQIRLLRFLQGGEVRRIGDTQERHVDVRLVLATHRSLEAEVASGRFRHDLYYRINVVDLRIPPLRDRPSDIRPLAEYIARRVAARNARPTRASRLAR